jgi:PAS domain S-box-containing protein
MAHVAVRDRVEAESRARQEVALYARFAAGRYEAAVAAARGVLAELAAALEPSGADPSAAARVIQAAKARHLEFLNVGAAAPDGTVVASAVPHRVGVSIADRPYFRRAREGDTAGSGDFQVGRITGRPSVNVGLPVLEPDGDVGAVVFAAIDLDAVSQAAAGATIPEGVSLALFARDGTVLARYPDFPRWVGTDASASPLFRAASSGPEATGTVEGLDGRTRIYGFAKLGSAGPAGAVLAVGVDRDERLAPAAALLRDSFVAIALVVGLALLFARLGGNRLVVAPLRRLVDAANRLRRGDFSARAAVARGAREVVALGACFDEMAEALERRAEEAARASRALRESEAEHRLLVDRSPDAILVHSGGEVVYANPAAATLLGVSHPAELVGRPVLEMVHPDDRDAARERARAAREGCTISPLAELRLLRADGRPVDIEAFEATLRFRDQEAVQLVARDVTARKSLEARLRQSQKLEAIGQLAGGVAHDFNNLLTVILGYCDMIARANRLPEEAARDLAEVQLAARRAAALTGQLLAFSRQQPAKPQRVRVDCVIGETEAMLRRLVGEDIEIRTVLAHALPEVRIDPNQLTQVFMNLVINARDAMPRGGKVTLEAAPVEVDESYAAGHAGPAPGRYVLLAVSDTGHGMDAATCARVFEPFFTTKPRGKGTGLGLATVYGIVKQAGGHVSVYSEVGTGTTFKILLPALGVEHAPAPAPTEPESERPRGSERVLLVEDEAVVRQFTAKALRDLGYRVVEAIDGADAMNVLAGLDEPVDLVITDVVMPNLSGPDLVARIARNGRAPRVLFTSGFTDHAMFHQGVLGEGLLLLVKPYTARSLAEKVRAALDARA